MWVNMNMLSYFLHTKANYFNTDLYRTSLPTRIILFIKQRYVVLFIHL